MTAPLIGVTSRKAESPLYKIAQIASPRSYSEALIRAGAIPVLIPLNLPIDRLQELLTRLDGVVFTGGGDIATACFDGEPHEKVYDVDDERDQIELALARTISDSTTPFLGICRGLQILNVAHGGTLYTHISDQLPGAIKHTFFPGHPWDYKAHEVQVTEGSRLSEIVSQPVLQVNSLHHQGIKDVGAGLDVMATAPDGLVEALSLPEHPFGLAVQWHPEWLIEDAEMRALFSAFVQAASRN